MQTFTQEAGIKILDNLITTIQENKQYLSDIDGAIGDGDHGINMNKGFTLCRETLDRDPGNLEHGLNTLSKILIMKIGGSMGPLYGKFFKSMAKAIEGKNEIDASTFGDMLSATHSALQIITPAKPGDKTMFDTLIPAISAYSVALDNGRDFKQSLRDMKIAAEIGKDSTKDMIAKLGRSSRLGERSKGVLDAGAVSCFLILCSMADTIDELLQ